MAPSLLHLILFSLLTCLVHVSYTSPAPANSIASGGDKRHAMNRRQMGAMANAISSIPAGELSGIFSGHHKSDQDSNDGYGGDTRRAKNRRQMGMMANSISSIPAGELNEIFSGHHKSDQDSNGGYSCQISDKNDATAEDSLSTCANQYQSSNGTVGLRCGGKGWYRGNDRSYSNPICQSICGTCLQDAATAGAEKVDCTFAISDKSKCWTGYH